MVFQSEIKNIESATHQDVTLVTFKGVLDEHAQLPLVTAKNTIHIDLSGVTYINSVGIRTWIRWLLETSKLYQVVLEKCPVLFVKNLSSIRGMLNKNTKVASFFVPYYDDKYNERKNILFVVGKDFTPDGTVTLPRITNSNNEVIAPDVIEQTYFSFLKL